MLTKEQVKEARKRLGLSQAAFGEAIAGISTNHVSNIESGKAEVPGWMENALTGLIMRMNGLKLDISLIQPRRNTKES
ncbi:helix-turn-helix transcriptional regulator [Salmonella enterica]|nr:helix-turn-helix transcriptional regulator [Salmonella enterica]